MAEVTRTGVPSLATSTPAFEHHRGGLIAAVDIAAGDALYLKGSDALVYKATAAAANEAARCIGLAARAVKAGGGVTPLKGVTMRYGPNVTGTATPSGQYLWLSATVAGGLSDASTANATNPVAQVLDNGVITIFDGPSV